MRRKMFWQAAVFAVLIFGGCPGASDGELGFVGVSPAEAKAYYTRKRVNGRWITGRFAKRNSSLQSGATEPSEASGIKVSAVQTSLTGMAPLAPGTRSDAAAPVKRLIPTSTLARVPPVPPATDAPFVSAPEAERLGKLRQALQARASSLTTETVVARPAPEPESVSLDFKSGMKTTLFSDGTTVTEPFDTAALKGLAAAPGEAKPTR